MPRLRLSANINLTDKSGTWRNLYLKEDQVEEVFSITASIYSRMSPDQIDAHHHEYIFSRVEARIDLHASQSQGKQAQITKLKLIC